MPSSTYSDFVYADLSYCSACDRYFPSEEARAQHVQYSNNHPRCGPCNKRFANLNSLRNHWVISPRHHYCAACELTFNSAAGLRVHIEFASVHRDDSDDDDAEEDAQVYSSGWEDEMGRQVYPEENDAIASDDESFDDANDYWDEDDQSNSDEDYYGFAPTSTFDPNAVYPRSRTPSEDSSISIGQVSHTAVGTVSDDGSFDGQEGAASVSSSYSDFFEEAPGEYMADATQQRYAAPSAVLFSCPLCLEAPRETSATRCGHVFCTSCINIALENKRMCPVCRMRASPMQLRKIFLSAN